MLSFRNDCTQTRLPALDASENVELFPQSVFGAAVESNKAAPGSLFNQECGQDQANTSLRDLAQDRLQLFSCGFPSFTLNGFSGKPTYQWVSWLVWHKTWCREEVAECEHCSRLKLSTPALLFWKVPVLKLVSFPIVVGHRTSRTDRFIGRSAQPAKAVPHE